ncbi:Panacea domain-containing protein [Methylocystis parvus]|uniref:Panacea domain-containing protein n=1 Tax=Methylocystis parvus TaxID=134 RepID=UPI003C70E5C3
MLISREREKLIQAIVFFVQNTKKCGKVKLFKLLYFLDFEHFKATGRSVTGLDYFAWKMGPVPVSLFDEIETPQPDMAEALHFEERAIRNGQHVMLVIKPHALFSDRHFSRRELELMRSLAAEYRDAEADDMVEATHLENTPWDRVFVQEGRRQQLIPYELAVRPDEREAVLHVANERAELIEKLT